MFVITRFSKRLIVILAVGLALFSGMLILQKYDPKPGSKSASAVFADCVEFLKKYGWEVDEQPIETEEITIPDTFDEVYIKYNELQKGQGFDLTNYKNKKVMRYTYSILNYPENIQNVRANLLAYDGRIIGGDICTVGLNGFMHGFDR